MISSEMGKRRSDIANAFRPECIINIRYYIIIIIIIYKPYELNVLLCAISRSLLKFLPDLQVGGGNWGTRKEERR